MEWIVITLIALVFVISGYFFIGKRERLITSPHSVFIAHPHLPGKVESKTALIFGNLDLSDEIAEVLNKLNVCCTRITSLDQIDKTASFNYLFAVDEDDLENLTVCTICEKMMGIKKRIAICNCFENIKVFNDHRIPFLCGYSISASSLVNELIPLPTESEGDPDD